MHLIRPLTDEYTEYLRDESRTTGHADSISFPQTEADVIAILKSIRGTGTQVTIQGARTGLAAAAVPGGGHVMNLSRMDAVTGCRVDENGHFFLSVQPGVILSQLRKRIEGKKFDASRWDEDSKAAYATLCRAGELFFPTDPTESSATIGGMVACNASGARSFFYGPMRRHVSGLRLVMTDGRTVALRRGECRADGRTLMLSTEQGDSFTVALPTFRMPKVKNASGYYIEDDMDAIDLFIGSDGTLGVITEIELTLSPSAAFDLGRHLLFQAGGGQHPLCERPAAQNPRCGGHRVFRRRRPGHPAPPEGGKSSLFPASGP